MKTKTQFTKLAVIALACLLSTLGLKAADGDNVGLTLQIGRLLFLTA